ncbi:hypothetical protein AB0C12_12655 [Actinoplanes sp. NPDC048967]|uniref:AI-2E family transporter n=1 Tax=Actinoplanes sp. NPDC048967 TaxID=3155269 RepID=UPI0033D8DCE8
MRRAVDPVSDGAGSTPYRRLLRAGKAAAAVLVLAVAGYVLIRMLVRVAPLTMAVVAAVLLTALIAPLADRFKRAGMPRSLAALLSVAGLLALIGAAFYFLGYRASGRLDNPQVQIVQGADRSRETLVSALPGLNQSRLDAWWRSSSCSSSCATATGCGPGWSTSRRPPRSGLWIVPVMPPGGR